MRKMCCSLHRAKTPKNCDLCGAEIPARKLPEYAEYWRVKGGLRGTPRVVCCLCHALYGLPENGWHDAPDGQETLAAIVPIQAMFGQTNVQHTSSAKDETEATN